MGNRNSSSTTLADSGKLPQSEATTTPSAQAGSSGVFLTNELQEQVIADFRSQVIKQQWENYQAELLEKVSHRQQQANERSEKLKKELQQWSDQNEKIQFELNSKLDEKLSNLTDMCCAANYDLERIKMKFVPSNAPDNGAALGNSPEYPCIMQQVNLASCYRKNPKEKSGVCDIYLNALDTCVKEVFLKKQ